MRYVFYTSDGFTQDLDNKNIENCQILGFSNGNNITDAYNNLLLENNYLKKYNFSNIFAVETKGEPISL